MTTLAWIVYVCAVALFAVMAWAGLVGKDHEACRPERGDK